MSTNQTEMNPNWAQPQKPRKGCGLLGCFLIGCGGVMVLCCGVGVWGIFYFRSMFSDDPAQIAAERDRIATINIPADLKPTMAINLKLPFYGDVGSGVIYSDGKAGTLMLIAVKQSAANAGEGDFQQALEQALRGKGPNEEKVFQAQKREEKQLTVRGKPVTFHFATGKNTKTGADMIEVSGTFDGKAGPTMFYFLGDAQKYDEKTLTDMIESIK